jgi:predicted nucleic-acid-binding protein
MIGLDTNVVVRYLMQDDPGQSARATDIFENRLTEEQPGFVSVVVVAEMAWVLQRSYGLGSGEIAAAVERLLQTDTLIIENEKEVFTAMSALKKGTGELADALIGTLGSKAGCNYTLTFDRKAARLPHFKAL